MFWLPKPFRHAFTTEGRLAIGGLVDRPNFGLTQADLAELPAKYQVSDVGAFSTPARGVSGPIQGVRVQALIDLVGASPEAMFLNARTRSGFAVSVWRREIERLAIVAYSRDGAPLDPEHGGPFRLLLPGFKDESRDLWDCAVIEFSHKPGEDSRNQRSQLPRHSAEPGDVQGGLSRSRVDPADGRTIVVPPPQ